MKKQRPRRKALLFSYSPPINWSAARCWWLTAAPSQSVPQEAQLAMRKINLASLSSDQERDIPTHSDLPLFRTEQRPRQQSLLEVTLKDSPYYQNLIVSSEL